MNPDERFIVLYFYIYFVRFRILKNFKIRSPGLKSHVKLTIRKSTTISIFFLKKGSTQKGRIYIVLYVWGDK